MDAKTVERRRHLYWELFSCELFYVRGVYLVSWLGCSLINQSMLLGRPPSIRPSYIDCEFPEDEQATLDGNGNVQMGCKCLNIILLRNWTSSVYRWKYEFMKEILATVAELTLAAKAPQYETVLDLDRKLREKILPSHLNNFVGSEQCSPSEYMRKCLLAHYRASSTSL
jgi:hypothetical protein